MSGPNPVLVYLPTGEVVSSIVSLQGSLGNLGWEMSIGGDAERLLYFKRPSDQFNEAFISVPKDFLKLTSVDIQDNILINSRQELSSEDFGGIENFVTPEYASELLEKAFLLNTVGNRLFYMGLLLMLWFFGPVLVFLSSAVMVPILYNLDFVFTVSNKEKGKVDCHGGSNDHLSP
ncbi:hypothetical protein Bca4012_016295 [Brassica carinata]|uniref:Uncharacterized protein n=1 Tax=Brassica carinata TaxID=52824 RepID=A0A8X8BI58_BRACI|nr:hypothetical protein Bca52824_006262 [Brassica carinata]